VLTCQGESAEVYRLAVCGSLEAGRTKGHIFTKNTVKAIDCNVILKELDVLKGLGIQFVNKEPEKCEAIESWEECQMIV